jgi:hypothetical protein
MGNADFARTDLAGLKLDGPTTSRVEFAWPKSDGPIVKVKLADRKSVGLKKGIFVKMNSLETQVLSSCLGLPIIC